VQDVEAASACLLAFEDIRLVGRDAAKCAGRTSARDRTIVAVDATVMPNLQVQRPVSEGLAPFHALAATNTKGFVNAVREVRIFDERALDGTDGAELVFRRCVQLLRFRAEIAAAQVTIAAHIIGVNAFHSGWHKDAIRGAAPALCAFFRIDLPEHATGLGTPRSPRHGCGDSGCRGCTYDASKELAA